MRSPRNIFKFVIEQTVENHVLLFKKLFVVASRLAMVLAMKPCIIVVCSLKKRSWDLIAKEAKKFFDLINVFYNSIKVLYLCRQKIFVFLKKNEKKVKKNLKNYKKVLISIDSY